MLLPLRPARSEVDSISFRDTAAQLAPGQRIDLRVAGQAAIVTGATRGIGLATARLLQEQGANVVFVGRDEAKLVERAAEAGGVALKEDVTEPDAAERIVECCIDHFGRLDILVNNAGEMAQRDLDELSDDEWQAQWELNVMGPMRLMRAGAPRMAAAEYGRIVNVSSSAGKRPTKANAAYSVTKAAELSLTKIYADAWARRNVLINAVTPGAVASPLWMAPGGLADQRARREGVTREEALCQLAERVPLGRLGRPEEAAHVIGFLCSPFASLVSGAAWSVDGGAVDTIP